ncbi:MAG: IS4 family transposase [Anaerolineales bacterium]|nr:IS4 family transposase [Anaerolineales bacterium]
MIENIVPRATIAAVLAAEGRLTARERKLNLLVTVLLIIMMNLYTADSIGAVLEKMAQGLRYIWPDPDYQVPNASAVSYRRDQVGARPVVALFHQVCRPLAEPDTPGAFLFGLRLMALDGTTEDVPDTPANAAAFGRHESDRGPSAFPQVKGVYLVECGTHAIVDAGFWPERTSERVGGLRLLRSLTPGMLVMWDRGFHDYDMFVQARQRGAHVLSRLPAHIKPLRLRTLADGSYLAYLRPSDYQRRKKGERLLVRVIEYTLTDPNLPGWAETHRLVTTLLDPEAYPILDLICAYHERWEIEITIDEIDTHQRLLPGPLRSRKPVGVIQELYGLLIAHYIIRACMYQAARQAQLDPDRLSFIGAVRILQQAVPEFQITTPEQLPALYQRLLRDMARKRLPPRRLRSNPRVVKRKMSNFKLKRAEHQAWPQPTVRSFREAIEVKPCSVISLPITIDLLSQPMMTTELVLI